MTRDQKSLGLFIVLAMLQSASTSNGQSMDFNDLPMGTLFGVAAGDAPADLVYSKNGIDMAVDSFFLGSFVGFFDAEIGGLYSTAFASPALELDNIAVVFSLGSLGFPVTALSFDYVEFGGAVNLAVNGQQVLELESFADLPLLIAPGVLGTVAGGSVALTGAISSLRIGGQELIIDNLVVIPEPVTAGLLLVGLGIIAAKRRLQRVMH